MSDQRLTRRTFVGGTVALAAGMAGCSGGGGTASGEGESSEGTSDETQTADNGSGDSAPSEAEEYLADTGNYDGVVDETGASEVTVTVGTEANGGNFGFGPAAVRVSPGTTVVWEWNGLGSSHNVVDEDGAFESELSAEDGYTFSQTLEESGVVQYYCTPHRTMGMKGVVVVE
jgi:halocyanin-like protein